MDKGVKIEAISSWDIADVLAEQLNLRREVVVKLIGMIETDECTIPFIARYRKEATNGMDPDRLRDFTSILTELRLVQKKSTTMIKNVEKQGALDVKTEASLLSAQTIDELEQVYAPFKGEKKSSLANRARRLGLDEAATELLSAPDKVNLRKWVKKGVEGKATLSEVETGVQHIIADIMSKDPHTIQKIREVFQASGMTIESKLTAKRQKELKSAENEMSTKNKSNPKCHSELGDAAKYESYYDFNSRLPSLESYKVLAINRGESQKHLTVKINISRDMEEKFLKWSKKYWISNIHKKDMINLLSHCIEDSYNRLVKPFVLRKARSELTKKAQQSAVEVFSRNLKKLLLTPPLRGKVVLGVDPGFTNGCKCAVIDSTGSIILGTEVIYLNRAISMQKIQQLYNNHKFNVIGIGNGTACRETEGFFSDFIARNRGSDLAYCIVNENGASIYSVTPEAQNELPDLDPNLRSAVSIARRLLDPLVELVKIEPKHIGVGMYQHDIPDTLIKAALNDVIEDCVTFVGVDLNTANESLLGRLAGLKKSQAKNIIDQRKKIGVFVNRRQLLEVKGIGEKTFQQCAGFVRISPKTTVSKSVKDESSSTHDEKVNVRKRKAKIETTSKAKKVKPDWKPNPLDRTWIHPESYNIAERLVKELNLDIESLGTENFIDSVKHAMYETGIRKLSDDLSTGVSTVQLIVDGLSQISGFRDIRNEMRRPIFRRGINSIGDLRPGTKVTGRVTNVTDFGVFVDVGVGQAGLIHRSNVGGRWEEIKRWLGPNDTAEVLVHNVDKQRKRIGLKLIHADMSKTSFA